MKIVTSSGKKKIKMSKKEWEGIGKTAGWNADVESNEKIRKMSTLASMDIPPIRFELLPDGWWEIEDKVNITNELKAACEEIARAHNLKVKFPQVIIGE